MKSGLSACQRHPPRHYVALNLPRITKHLNLVLILARHPCIPLPRKPLPVLSLQQKVGNKAPAKQEQNHVREHHSMARFVVRLVLRAVDIARHNAVEIAPADDEADGDTTFIYAFGVGRSPRDGICNTWIDTQCTKEGACVLDVRVGAAQEHTKACDTEKGGANVAPPTLIRAVCQPADKDGQHSGGGVRRDREQIGSGGFVAKLADDGWQEE